MSEVTVVGSINLDLTSYLERWPQIGETVFAKEALIALGGKGANQAVAASRMGAKTAIVGAIGSDAFGADITQRFSDHAVTLNLSVLDAVATGTASIDVGPGGGNIIRVNSGANGALTAKRVDAYSECIANSKVVLLQNEIPIEASLRAAKIAKSAGALVIMDPAPTPVPFWTRSALEAFDILTPNSHEAEAIIGHAPKTLSDAEEAARNLASQGVTSSIITMGSLGVAWSINGDTGYQTAPRVDSIDTVGAGDCFNGAFAAAHAMGKPVTEAIGLAVHAAALSTTRVGAAVAMPSLEEMSLGNTRT